MVFAPPRAEAEWQWVGELPTAGLPWQRLAVQPAERKQLLSALMDEVGRRQQALATRSYDGSQAKNAPLPHLLIVVDSFANGPRRDENDPLVSPALALALRDGQALGMTVLSVHAARSQAPAQVTLAVNLAQRRILSLGPEPAAEIVCSSLDRFSPTDGGAIASALEHQHLESQASLTWPREVRLLPLLGGTINSAADYAIKDVWNDSRARLAAATDKDKPPYTIPLGLKLGGEPLYLDFVNDGPHGLLIGQTGSGKSELLRSIISALAVQYAPDQVNLVLVDYKGGLAFDAYGALPHTVAYLTNMAQPGQTTRFLEMLEAEIVRRQEARALGTPQAELFVIIDEFAEMVSRRSSGDTNDVVLDNLLSITRLGRELGVHLLFAAQRPEGSVIQKLRGYLQYRICLRTNTEEDSRDVIYTPDAARLPLEARGRGYLLRGDNELTQFQGAKVTIKSRHAQTVYTSRGGEKGSYTPLSRSEPPTADVIIAERMQTLKEIPVAARWPIPLPEPTLRQPTPLILTASATPTSGMRTWDAGQYAALREMEVPLGLYDRPRAQAQGWYKVDLLGHEGRMHGGPLLVMGDLNSGKTTTLQTLLLALAQTHGPSQLRWFILNPSDSLSDFKELPQSRDLYDASISNVSDGQDPEEFRAFASRFTRMAKQPAGARPAMLLVVDDYNELGAQYTAGLHDLAKLAIGGRYERRLYLAISAASRPASLELPSAIIGNMATRIALYMSDRDNLRGIVNGRPPRSRTRRSSLTARS